MTPFKENVTDSIDNLNNLISRVNNTGEKFDCLYTSEENIDNMLVNNVDSKSGSNVTINNTVDGGKFDWEIQGSCEQDSYSGKQLIGLVDGTYTANEGEVTAVVSNGVITLNGTTTQTNFVAIVANTNYSSISSDDNFTISLNNPVANDNVSFRNQPNGTYDAICNSINKIQTSIFRDDRPFQSNITIRVAGGVTLTNFVLQPQLEKGSTATSWEQYTGGIPAPNPTYPQNIRVVTGDVDVVVQSENKLDRNTIELTQGYINSNDEVIDNVGWLHSDYIEISNNNVLYVTEQANTPKILLYNSSKTKIAVIDVTPQKIDLTQYTNAYYIRISIIRNASDSYVMCQEQTKILHLGSEYLAGIDTYDDEIVGKTNAWKIDRNVGKKEQFLSGALDENVFYWAETNRALTESNNKVCYCNKLFFNGNYSNLSSAKSNMQKYQIAVNNNGSSKNIFISNPDLTTKEEYLAWLVTISPTLYYQLAESTQTNITDTDLISDLNDLYELLGYDGQTNISIVPAVGNATPSLKVTGFVTEKEV